MATTVVGAPVLIKRCSGCLYTSLPPRIQFTEGLINYELSSIAYVQLHCKANLSGRFHYSK